MDQKTAIVTGGGGASAGGSGRYIAHKLADQGYFIVVWDIDDDMGIDTLSFLKLRSKRAAYVHCDVTKEEQVKEAVEAGADIIMLDNMSDEDMRKAVTLIAGRAKTECSGNVTRENIARLRDIGIDYVSSGALTHSAPILDLSMKHLRPLTAEEA